MQDPLKARRRRLALRLALVLLPTLLAAIYYGLFAANQFVSEASFVIRDAADQPQSTGMAQLAAQNRASAAAYAVQAYLRSRAALADTQAKIDLRQAWAGHMDDPFTALPPHASNETLYDRYTSHISVSVDSNSGAVTLTAKAFDPAGAQSIAARLLQLAANTTEKLSNPGHLVLISLVPPNLPDQAAEPHRFRLILTVLGFNLIFAAMAWLVGTGLREHAAKGR